MSDMICYKINFLKFDLKFVYSYRFITKYVYKIWNNILLVYIFLN